MSKDDRHVTKLAPVFSVPRVRVVEREPELLRLCEGRRVLHLGCADVPYTLQRGDALLHKQLARVTEHLSGIDTSGEGCDLLRAMGFQNILTGSLGNYTQATLDEGFDIILAGEVIEHTNNAGLFLEEIRAAMGPETELILTTVNTPSLANVAFALTGREKVHPDHNYYFSYHTLKTIVMKHGLNPVDICYYMILNTAVDKVLSPLKKVWPVTSDGLILRARRDD